MKKNIIDKFRLDGKVAILTGSAGRIGQRFAHVLSDAGANVVLVDIEEKSNKKLNKRILAKYKKIDILINNAHSIPRTNSKRDAPFEDYPLELWDDAISSNLRGIFLCSQEFGKTMIKQKKGVIINISSIYGMVGADQRIYGKSRLNSPAFYSATKGATVNLTRYLAAYWHQKNIRVNTLTLGGVFDSNLHKDKNFVKNYSNKTMIGRMGKKEDFDGGLLFLASDASEYVTGSNVVVDGGWTSW